MTQQRTGPSAKDVRHVMRDLTRMIDARPGIQDEIGETRILLRKTMSVVEEGREALKEVVWMRFCLEQDFMRQLKEDQTLWDGTRLMKGEPRRKWEELLSKEREQKNQERERQELEAKLLESNDGDLSVER